MDAAWLKEHVGSALEEGMSRLVAKQPDDPVDFLGRFLLQYADYLEKEELKKKYAQINQQVEQENIVEKHRKEKQDEERIAQENADAEYVSKLLQLASQDINIVYDEQRHGVSSQIGLADDIFHEYSQRIEQAVAAIAERTTATTVCIGVLEGENSVRIISSSDKSLENEIITNDEESPMYPFELLQPDEEPAEEATPPAGNDDENPDEPRPPVEPKKARIIHVSNVLQNDSVPFLSRAPVLGSFLAIRLPYDHYMSLDAIPAEEEKTPNPEPTEDGETAVQEEKEEEFKANPSAGSYFILLDTMGNETYQNGFPESDIEFVRSYVSPLSQALSRTQKTMIRAEMGLRHRLDDLTEANKILYGEAMSQVEARMNATKEAMPPVEPDDTKLAEEITYAEKEQAKQLAQTAMDTTKELLGNDNNWWLPHLSVVKKLQIPPEPTVIEALQRLGEVYGWSGIDSWANLKLLDNTQIGLDIARLGPEDKCNVQEENACALAEELSKYQQDGNAMYVSAMVAITRASLDAIGKQYEYMVALEQMESAKQVAAEAEAAAAAEEEEEKQDGDAE